MHKQTIREVFTLNLLLQIDAAPTIRKTHQLAPIRVAPRQGVHITDYSQGMSCSAHKEEENSKWVMWWSRVMWFLDICWVREKASLESNARTESVQRWVVFYLSRNLYGRCDCCVHRRRWSHLFRDLETRLRYSLQFVSNISRMWGRMEHGKHHSGRRNCLSCYGPAPPVGGGMRERERDVR